MNPKTESLTRDKAINKSIRELTSRKRVFATPEEARKRKSRQDALPQFGTKKQPARAIGQALGIVSRDVQLPKSGRNALNSKPKKKKSGKN